MKGCVFDIETSDLAAVGAGVFLCAVVKPLGGDCKVFRYDNGGERRAVESTIRELARFDLWIGHNIVKFDYPFIKSKAEVMGLEIPRPFYYDTLQAFRRVGYLTRQNGFGKPCGGLDFVVDFFDLPQQKTKILPRHHWDSIWASGKKKRAIMQEIIEHCVADVQMNEQIYWRLMRADYGGFVKRFR